MFLQQSHIKLLGGVLSCGQRGFESKSGPSSLEIKTQFMFAAGLRGTCRVDSKNGFQFLQQRFGGLAIQVAHHTIVRKDLDMGVWKKDGKKPGAAACSFARLKSARGCGAAMMAISNIERWNAGKGAGDKIDLPRLANRS